MLGCISNELLYFHNPCYCFQNGGTHHIFIQESLICSMKQRRLEENNKNSTSTMGSHFKANCWLKVHNVFKVRIANFGISIGNDTHNTQI